MHLIYLWYLWMYDARTHAKVQKEEARSGRHNGDGKRRQQTGTKPAAVYSAAVVGDTGTRYEAET